MTDDARVQGTDESALRALAHLRSGLEERTRWTLARHRPEVATAITWLAAAQHDDGYWGEPDDEGTTALCAIAVALWRPASPGANGDAGAATSAIDVPELIGWLQTRAEAGFSTPWYTAVNLHALASYGLGGSPVGKQLADVLGRLDPRDEQAWLNRGHHAGQILEALVAIGADDADLARWAAVAEAALQHSTDHYVAGQIVHALLVRGVSSHGLAAPIAELCRYLDDEPLSKASFLQYAPALLALGAARTGSELAGKAADKKSAELLAKFPETHWYRDPEYVAWSLMALHECEGSTEVIVDLPTFANRFDEAQGLLIADQRRTRRIVALLAFVLGVDVSVGVYLSIVGAKSFLLTSVVFGLVVVATLTYSVRKIRDYLR